MLSSSSSSSSEEEEIVVRRPKIYPKRKDYVHEYDELDFFDRFRLTKATVINLLEKIENLIVLPTNRYFTIINLPHISIYRCMF